jgi:2-polyprenyl-6-hydroxyphenyl methylase/3-demethylubiquinone-9 3-methyltransferase
MGNVPKDLTRQDTHFAFGKNWASYARSIGRPQIDEAVAGLSRLLDGERLEGKRFLDIGSGSGLHALAAFELGAAEVVALDIDPDSVETTRAVLALHAPGRPAEVAQASVFDLSHALYGRFDVVYSWGVLHHTGDMLRAIRVAASLVAEGGQFVFALYRRIWMDPFWRLEKRWYSKAPLQSQARARALYVALFRLGLGVTGRRFADYVAAYTQQRGMDFHHDVHDWMGGWPYESILPREVATLMSELGFARMREFAARGLLGGRRVGLFGSGCDEYVYRRVSGGTS